MVVEWRSLRLATVNPALDEWLDRRYSQARGFGGYRASESSMRQREALTRATAARNRIPRRTTEAQGPQRGPNSVNPYIGADTQVARSAAKRESDEIFREEGSGVFGPSPVFASVGRWDRDGREGLLPGLS